VTDEQAQAIIRALDRQATALETIALNIVDLQTGQELGKIAETNPTPTLAPVMQSPVPEERFAPIPRPGSEWRCPQHGTSRVVPAGISARTGQSYNAFLVCGERGCDQKPPRAPAPARVLP
jgi:hypothetical protein